MFTREQLIAMGFDPDKAITAMNADPSKDQVINPEPQIPFRRQEDIPVQPNVPDDIPATVSQPVARKSLPKIQAPSLEDKQADAMAALDVLGEQQKASAPLPSIAQNVPQEPSQPKDDILTRYMNMMDQIKRDESSAMQGGQADLKKARLIDGLLNASSTIGEAFSRGRGGDLRSKDLYTDQPRVNAEKDYADLIRQYQQKKADVGNDLGVMSGVQKVRSGESDFEQTQQARDPNSEMSKLYRDQYRKLNPDIQISDDLSAEAVSKLLSGKKAGTGEVTPWQKMVYEQNERKLANSVRRSDQADRTFDRLENQTLFNQKQKDELSDKQVEDIVSFDKVLGLSGEIRKSVNDKIKTFLGTYASKGENAKDYIPLLEKDPDFVKFQANVTDNLSQYIKVISGLTVSDKERAALQQSAPKVTDKPNEFISKLDAFEKRLNEFKQRELDAIKKYQGKDTEGKNNDPRVDNFMRKNGITDRNQAIQILKQAGKI